MHGVRVIWRRREERNVTVTENSWCKEKRGKNRRYVPDIVFASLLYALEPISRPSSTEPAAHVCVYAPSSQGTSDRGDTVAVYLQQELGR